MAFFEKLHQHLKEVLRLWISIESPRIQVMILILESRAVYNNSRDEKCECSRNYGHRVDGHMLMLSRLISVVALGLNTWLSLISCPYTATSNRKRSDCEPVMVGFRW
jgi:hypothetical protein